MPTSTEPFEELPYESITIEWTAPERLALASILHGGPRSRLDRYRVLELGCGDGTNTRALAYYRPHGEFVGLDGARRHVEMADRAAAKLELGNLAYVHANIEDAAVRLEGEFDYILAHGVFSWVSDDVREALLTLIADRLRPDGLAYLGYNTRPGWNIRGMVRDFLLTQTAQTHGVRARAERAREISAKLAAVLATSEPAYSQLLAREFALVRDFSPSHVAHEYLAPHNHAFWQSEFAALAGSQGLEIIADADFYCASGRIPDGLESWLRSERLEGPFLGDTVDLLCYRQHQCPILSRGPIERRPPTVEEFSSLWVASCLKPHPPEEDGAVRFEHPSGTEITVRKPELLQMLEALQPLWPRGRRVAASLSNVADVVEDLQLLTNNGLIELRCFEPQSPGDETHRNTLNELEAAAGDYVTNPYHGRISVL